MQVLLDNKIFMLYCLYQNRIQYQFCIAFLSANPAQNASGYLVSWCRYFNNTKEKFRLKTEVNFDPSEVYKTYVIKFDVRSEEATLVSFPGKASLVLYRSDFVI